ncbi:chitin synthase 2 [Diutina catenulata]
MSNYSRPPPPGDEEHLLPRPYNQSSSSLVAPESSYHDESSRRPSYQDDASYYQENVQQPHDFFAAAPPVPVAPPVPGPYDHSFTEYQPQHTYQAPDYPPPPMAHPNTFMQDQPTGQPTYPPLKNSESYEYEEYEMQPQGYHQAQYYSQPLFAAGDSEDREWDQNIEYGQIEGDNFELTTAVPDSEPVRDAEGDGDEEDPFHDGSEKVVTSGVNGHLVLDCPVATELLSKYPGYNPAAEQGGLSREFAYMRYTAITCGPSNFYRNGFILRGVHCSVPRSTELMVVVTMYNEDDVLLARTLKGVFKNIKYLMSKNHSSTWGKDAWKKVVVCIVSDGRSKINPRAQALLAALGVYQDGLARSQVNDKKVQAHLYEYTTRVGISSVEDTVKLTTEKTVPVQLLFCLKEKNAKKINSHRWCFQALARVLDPKVVVLLDAGTQPSGKSLYHLWKEFDRDPQVAGACGEIKAKLQGRQIITNPLVYGQNFEYKMSNILDKPMESVFGFISVLPGAFSAYRLVALQNDINGQGPLEKYFKGEFMHSSATDLDPDDDEYELKKTLMAHEAGIFTSNMYLAEDRILCFELVAKRGCSWLLRYVRSASAETDVPEHLAEFILQRRRWLNGSFFAAIYSLVHFAKIWSSSHSFMRKFFFHIEFIYQFVNLVMSWFNIASYFLVFRILTTGLTDPALNFAPGKVLGLVFLWLYVASIVTTFVLSFGNKPKGTEKFYVVIVLFFAVLMVYMMLAAVWMAVYTIKDIFSDPNQSAIDLMLNPNFRDLIVATGSTYCLYFVASFMYLEPWHMFTSFIQYILLSPSYVNVLNIYAFCNIDDVSWGTKGDTGAHDLGTAVVKEDGTFAVNIAISAEEINKSYLKELDKIKQPAPPEKGGNVTSNEDYYKYVRSMTVLVWMLTNFIIVAVVLETGGLKDFDEDENGRTARSEIFLTVVLWIVAFMALFRFIGCSLYLLGRMFKRKKH